MSHLTNALRAASVTALIGSFSFAGTATATGDPNTGSSADINTLAASLPKGYGLNNCQPAQLTGGAKAELDCGQNPDPSGPKVGIYVLYGNSTDTAASFSATINGVSLSACGDSGQSPGTWHQGGQTAGQIACGTYQNAATVTYTIDSKNVVGHIVGSNTDVASLYKWWQAN
jgi:hypothetical protein